MTPYLAPSLAVLRAELNARWPNRDHTSDGWIGDTRHQATKSDHNPNSRGSVDAIDVDEDGVDFAVVFAAIKRHPSARYVIYERKLYHRLRGWKPEPYSGVNPHDKHFHVSIDQTRAAEQDRRPWGLLEDDMTPDELRRADIWTNPYPDRATNPKMTMESFVRNVGGDTYGTKLAVARVESQVAALRAELAAVAGRDPFNEQQVIDGVLAGLAGVDLDSAAAALRAAFGDRTDELAARLQG